MSEPTAATSWPKLARASPGCAATPRDRFGVCGLTSLVTCGSLGIRWHVERRCSVRRQRQCPVVIPRAGFALPVEVDGLIGDLIALRQECSSRVIPRGSLCILAGNQLSLCFECPCATDVQSVQFGLSRAFC